MLERVIRLYKSITRVFYIKEHEQHKDKNLTESEIKDLKEICTVLNPFFLITEKLSGEKYPTISIILPSIELLKKSVRILVDQKKFNIIYIYQFIFNNNIIGAD